MATVAQSLFGVTPESLMAAREQRLQEQALQFAQLSPMQAAQAGFYTAGSRLGTGIGGLLGAEDPELMRVRQRQQILQGVDISDPEALRGAASRLLQSGDSPAAAELAKRALDIEKAQAQITKDTAAAAASEAAAKRDRTPQTPADIAKAQRIAALRSAIPAYEEAGDKVTAKQLKDELDALLPEGSKISFGTDREAVASEVYGKPFAQLTQPEKAAVNKRVEETSRKGTTVNVSLKQEEAVTKSNVEAFGSLRDRAITSGATLEAVKSIKPLIDRSFAGFGSNVKLTAAQIADAFGVPISGASETEQLRSLQNNLKIGNSTVLKGALSDKDMAILGEAIGQGTVTKAGLRGIINNIEKDALITQREYQLANEFQQSGRLSQYDFVSGSSKARKEVNDKLKRLRELEQKAQQGAR